MENIIALKNLNMDKYAKNVQSGKAIVLKKINLF